MSENPLLLEARSRHHALRRRTAVDNVNFPLREVELRCLIGPNGAGKSTFFKMLTGQLRPTEGADQVSRQDVTSAADAIARLGVGIKTQVPNVFNGLYVGRERVRRGGPPARGERPRAGSSQTLARLRLEPDRRTAGRELAHGQRQWVEIAMVLAQEPDLILLDEPAAGMTHEEVLRTAELIREINQAHALIVVEHDMQFIRMIASTVTVFNQGRILIEACGRCRARGSARARRLSRKGRGMTPARSRRSALRTMAASRFSPGVHAFRRAKIRS